MDRLEQLKAQVREQSNQQYKLQLKKEKLQKELQKKEEDQEYIEQEMQKALRSMFAQTTLQEQKEREDIKDQIEQISYKQTLLNNQIIDLNVHLKDTNSLKELYELKQNQLEKEYLERKFELENDIEKKERKLSKLEKEIQVSNAQMKEILKEQWIKKAVAIIIVVFVAVLVGGFFGWGTFKIMDSIIQFFKGLFA